MYVRVLRCAARVPCLSSFVCSHTDSTVLDVSPERLLHFALCSRPYTRTLQQSEFAERRKFQIVDTFDTHKHTTFRQPQVHATTWHLQQGYKGAALVTVEHGLTWTWHHMDAG